MEDLDQIKILGRLFRIYMENHDPDGLQIIKQRMMLAYFQSGSSKSMIELMG